jgi:hypothetical protein
MSVTAMGKVWELDLPHQEILVLLALADHADHLGRHVRPSLALIAWKTNYSKRQVIRIIQSLETKKLLRIHRAGGGRGRATEYTLHLENGVRKSPFRKDDMVSQFEEDEQVFMPSGKTKGDMQNSDTMTQFHVKSDMVTPFTKRNSDICDRNSDIAMSPQPSVDPSERKTNSPSVVSPPYEGSAIDNFEQCFSPTPSKLCPPGFTPDPSIRTWAQKEFPQVDYDEALAAMRDYEFSQPRENWNAVLKTWIRREAKSSHAARNGTRRQPNTPDLAEAEAIVHAQEEKERNHGTP